MTMADRIAVLNHGKILQVGTPAEIYDHPATTFVAQLVGSPRINLLEAERENGLACVVGSEVRFPLPADFNLPQRFTLGLRPEDIHFNDTGEFSGVIELLEPLGVETIVHIRSGEQTFISVIAGLTPWQRGESVRFNVLRDRLGFFDQEGTRLTA